MFVGGWGNNIGPTSQNRNGAPVGINGCLVADRVNAERQSADNAKTGSGKLVGEVFGALDAVRSWFPGADNSDAGHLNRPVAADIEYWRRVGDMFQEFGVKRIIQGDRGNLLRIHIKGIVADWNLTIPSYLYKLLTGDVIVAGCGSGAFALLRKRRRLL